MIFKSVKKSSLEAKDIKKTNYYIELVQRDGYKYVRRLYQNSDHFMYFEDRRYREYTSVEELIEIGLIVDYHVF